MGVRIHKVIGYGLTDVVPSKEKGVYRPDDPRLNPHSILFDQEGEWSKGAYVDFLNKKAEADDGWGEYKLQAHTASDELKHWTPDQSFVYQGEYGLPNVLLVTVPVMHSAWFRYADAIDYEESLMRPAGEPVNYWKPIKNGIYPYARFYMDSRTGNTLMGIEPERFVYTLETLKRKLSEEARAKFLFLRDEMAHKMGFVDAEEAERLMAPIVPDEIKNLCEFGKLFTEPKYMSQLRPILYVFWS